VEPIQHKFAELVEVKMKFIFVWILVFFSFYSFANGSIEMIQGRFEFEDKAFFEFKLKEKVEGSYLMEVKNKQTNKSCDFNVQRISAPQRTRGRNGIIWSNNFSNCVFEMGKNKTEKFISLDFSYTIKASGELSGDVIIRRQQGSKRVPLIFSNL
jgi:hypothetical protein